MSRELLGLVLLGVLCIMLSPFYKEIHAIEKPSLTITDELPQLKDSSTIKSKNLKTVIFLSDSFLPKTFAGTELSGYETIKYLRNRGHVVKIFVKEYVVNEYDNFPIYKDLEPFKQYDFQHIQGLHEIILVILTYMHTFIGNKEHDLKVYQTKNQIGLNIDSFVSTFSFNNIVMNQRAMLFINYMEFFHKSHTKYLKRFATKVNLMLSQINNDIKMDTVQNTQAAAKDTVNELKSQNLDKKLFK
jgi:hypothetical protein